MKKNKMMRLAGLLLVAVLLTTSIISGTFAKYVTRGEIADEARVAKFGVTIAGSGNLFAQNYYRQDLGNTPGVKDDTVGDATLTVESSNGDKLVAPGTQNSTGMSLAISGAPEVDVRVTLKIEDGSKDVWLGQAVYADRTTAALGDMFSNEILYRPIVYTLKLGTTELAKGNIDEIKAFLADYSLYVDANTNMSDPAVAANYVYNLTWAWDFDNDGAGTYDKQDTLLGDIAAYRDGKVCDFRTLGESKGTCYLMEGTHYNIDTAVTISATVTQVD